MIFVCILLGCIAIFAAWGIYPRSWVVGVTCLFACSVIMATLTILRLYGAVEISPPEIWSATAVAAALSFGGIFLFCHLRSRRLKRKAREQQ